MQDLGSPPIVSTLYRGARGPLGPRGGAAAIVGALQVACVARATVTLDQRCRLQRHRYGRLVDQLYTDSMPRFSQRRAASVGALAPSPPPCAMYAPTRSQLCCSLGPRFARVMGRVLEHQEAHASGTLKAASLLFAWAGLPFELHIGLQRVCGYPRLGHASWLRVAARTQASRQACVWR